MATHRSRTNRRRQSGSIHKRKDGRWAATVDTGYVDGKRKRKTIYGPTKAAVDEELTRFKRAQQQGLPVLDERRTVADLLNAWVVGLGASEIRSSTRQRYVEMVSGHLVPALGRIRLAKLRPEDVQALYASKLEAGLRPRTVVHIHRVLHMALKQAERWGHVVRNVAALVSPPRIEHEEMNFLRSDEVASVVKAAREDRLEALYVLAISTAMRQGELLGLRWSDIDFEQRRLHVRRSLRRLKGQGLVAVPPKSAASRRTIPLSEACLEALKAHRAAQAEVLLSLGPRHSEEDYVFTNDLGGPIDASNLIHRNFKPLVERAGLRLIRFHDLRHTAISMMISEGIDPKTVQAIAGHSSIAVTMSIYAHVMPGLKEQAAEVMGAAIERALAAG